MEAFIFNGTGILGVALTLLAYFLLVMEKIAFKSFIYPFLNLIGAIFILISLFYAWNLASFFIEIAWIIISLYGLWTNYKEKK